MCPTGHWHRRWRHAQAIDSGVFIWANASHPDINDVGRVWADSPLAHRRGYVGGEWRGVCGCTGYQASHHGIAHCDWSNTVDLCATNGGHRCIAAFAEYYRDQECESCVMAKSLTNSSPACDMIPTNGNYDRKVRCAGHPT